MRKLIQKLRSFAPTKRKLIQLYSALLFNANLKGFASGNIYKGDTKQFCVPGINCYSCPGAVGACPLGSLQGSFSADKSTIFYVGGILLLYGILFGRLICGWLCPFGLIQELLYKIKTPKLKKSPVTRILSYFKYVLLVFFVFLVPIAYAFRDTPFPAFCKYICPAGTLEGGISLLSNKVNASYFSMLGPIFTWKFLLFISIAVGSIFAFRLFCRFLCPLGALYGLFHRLSVFGVTVKQPDCIHCGLCVSHCKMDVRHVNDQECIHCGECIPVCPTNAIQWKGPAFLNRKKEQPADSVNTHKKARLITRTISCLLLLGVLAGAIIGFWNSDRTKDSHTSTGQPERGNEVGDLCFSGKLDIIDGSGATGQTINPAGTGKLTIINFWGTWCTPCVHELPYFDQIASEYKDSVSVIAVHTNMGSEDAPDYVKEYYPESAITFVQDMDAEGYYSLLGGRDTYPYTVVLDEDGIVRKIFFEALEYEDLKEVVEEWLGK